MTRHEDVPRPAAAPRLTVFDTSPIVAGSDAREALNRTVDLARFAESSGYHRHWVAEHHGMKGVASCATAVVMERIASATSRIRVGSGAALLSNHAAVVLAEQFGTLEAFHPGRIDLGLGRASGGGPGAVERVRGGTSPAPFAEQLAELMRYFEPEAVDDPIRAVPAIGNRPPIWLLGSSEVSARLAASLGLPYSFGHHINPAGTVAALDVYRSGFRPSRDRDRPRVMVAVPVIAADTDGRAERLAGPIKAKVVSRSRGTSILLPSPEDAATSDWTDEERMMVDERFAHYVIGSQDTVETGLRTLLDATGADELAIQAPIHGHADRRRSYEMVAEIAAGSLTASGHRRTRLSPAGDSTLRTAAGRPRCPASRRRTGRRWSGPGGSRLPVGR
ncbi:MsnO8 family LLM class oxidoreductase [Pseudonocardia sediminis]